MASKIQTSFVFSRNGIVLHSRKEARTSTGDSISHNVVTVGTSEVESQITTDIATAREVIVHNKDLTNYINLGFVSGVYPVRINPGGFCKLDLEPTHSEVYLKADTASCKCEVVIMEE